MFSEFTQMLNFITLAPFYIVGAFVGTFAFVKLVQSELLYEWVTSRMDMWRARQVRKVRSEMMLDIAAFLRGRKEQDLAPVEQRIYYRILESYYQRMERLYSNNSNTRENV
jgi:hypothetical protein